MLHLAQNGDIAPEENQTAGQEAITLARRALEIRTQIYGLENVNVAISMIVLADALAYFNIVDDDEVIRLYEQSIAIAARVEGNLSANVAIGEDNLGRMYHNKAQRAHTAIDLDRCVANLELALPHFREAARIYRVINYMDDADKSVQRIAEIEEELRQCTIATATAAAVAAAATAAAASTQG